METPIVQGAQENQFHIACGDGRGAASKSGLMTCCVCHENFDPADLSAVAKHEHSGIAETGGHDGKLVGRTYTKEQSSNIAEVRYDDAESTMDVTFHNGGRYRYLDIPQAVFDDAVSADSIGRFMSQKIKGAYRYYNLAGD